MDGIGPQSSTAEREQSVLIHRTRTPLKTLLLTLLLIVVLIIIVLVAVGYFSNYNPSASQSSSQPPTTVNLTGALLLSFAPASTTPGYHGVLPFFLDIAKNKVTVLQGTKLTGETQAFTQQYHISSNGKWATFIGQGLAANSTSTLKAEQVYRKSLAGAKSMSTLAAILQKALPVSNNSDLKHDPVISDNGAVLYMSLPYNAPPSNAPESWNIVYVSASGTPQTLVQGTFPQWVDANRFIFLKSDGLYMYSLDTGYSQKLWGTQAPIMTNSMIDLSNDGSLIAWSVPEAKTVTLLRVLDWSGPTLTLRGTISVQGLWPVISPDDSAVAILTPYNAPASSNAISRLEFFSTATLQQINKPILFTGSVFDQSSLTDWTP